jgi:hypothetical protein
MDHHPSLPSAKRNLVLVRTGAEHRIKSLLGICRAQRSWDLAISLYDDLTLGDDACIDFRHYYRGGKWDGIYSFFKANAHLVAAYDFFWLMDDDIETTQEQVDALFLYVRSHNFELAQPALTLDSYYSHRLTLRCPGFSHRHANLIEIMAPILSRRVLEQVMPLFATTRSGFGLDWHWQRVVDDPEHAIAIIDAQPVGHRRPLRQHLQGMMRKEGVCPYGERQQLIEMLKLKRVYAIATAGMLEDGRLVSSRFRMGWLMIGIYWQVRRLITARPWTIADFIIFWWRQLFMPLGPSDGRSNTMK